MRFQYYKWFHSQLKCVDVSFALSHDMPLRKLSSGLWFGMPWRSCELTVMTMLQNVISVLQMIMSPIRECWCFLCFYSGYAVQQTIRWGFDTSWRSCGVTVITILQNAIWVLQMISSSIKVLGYFFCSQSWHAIEQIVKWTVTSGAMMLVCHHCNDNVAKRDFSNGNTRASAWVIS